MKLIVVVLSLGVIAGSYAVAFGVPDQVSQLIGNAPTEVATPRRGQDAGLRGQGRPTTVALTPLAESKNMLVLRAVSSAVSLRRADVIATEADQIVEIALQAIALVEDIHAPYLESGQIAVVQSIIDVVGGLGFATVFTLFLTPIF